MKLSRCALVLALIWLAGCSGGSELRGTVTDPAREGETQPGRWAVTVELDGDRVAGSTDVQAAFDEENLTCEADGSLLDPTELKIGDQLTFTRQPDTEVETMDPPVIAVIDVVATCG
jgi:hypothetical protein